MNTGSMPADLDLRLHHVGIVVPDLAIAAREYQSRFGLQAVSGIIHDPTQTAFVQFLRFPSDTTCIELVAPDGPNSKLSNALRKGGGLNHLCYATVDIDRTVEQMQARGMRLIATPVPAVAFAGGRIAWLIGRDFALVELVELAPGNMSPYPEGTNIASVAESGSLTQPPTTGR